MKFTKISSIMDSKSKANSPDYLKDLIFTKESGVLKLMEFLPLIQVHPLMDRNLRITYLKIFPVFFSHVELSQRFIEQCLSLIAEIKRHPLFVHEKSMFNAWKIRLRNLLPDCELTKEDTKLIENKFVNIPGTNMYDIIGYAELELYFRYHKWLKHHKLHKYLYFFANLSFTEIQSINANNITSLEEKIGLHTMTTGARNAIVKKLAELNQRSTRLEIFCQDNYFTCVSKIEKTLNEIKLILKTPIKKNHVFCQSDLPELVKKAMQRGGYFFTLFLYFEVMFAVMRLPKDDFKKVYEPSIALLKMAWGCFFFDENVKNELNVLQSNLNSKMRRISKKRFIISKNINHDAFYEFGQKDICTVHFDIENGIQAITWYLENVILFEEI